MTKFYGQPKAPPNPYRTPDPRLATFVTKAGNALTINLDSINETVEPWAGVSANMIYGEDKDGRTVLIPANNIDYVIEDTP